ncbi:MAG: tyrosine-type recombinase/integrase [Oscillospiraceae bacterium]|nr:tyrosine-type recombinase/integrase [Oscillospiraceae bacterium]
MASIVKRGKSYSVVYYEGEGKNRHQVWESGLSYSAAKARKATIEYEIEQNTHVNHNDITVSEFLYEFVEKYGEKKWVASTYDGNVGLLENYVHPYLGDKKLRSIRTKTIDDYYHFLLTEAEPATNMGKPMRDHVTPSMIHDIHKVMRCAFNQAKKWEYIAKNPFLDATLPEHKESKRDALTPEQLQRLLDFTDRPEIYDLYVMHCAIQLAFACCLRGGEIGGSQWNRLDDSSQTLFIDRVIDRVDKKLIDKLQKMEVLFRFPNLYPGTRTVICLKQPKTEGSIRTCYVPETVMKKLAKLREIQNKLKIELGDDGYMDYGLIICQANGRPIMTEHLNKRFKDVLAELNDPTINIDNVVFHSLRHTSTSVKLRLSKGDLKAVQGDGGWNTPDMITKRYAHIMDEDRRRLADEMEARFYQGKTDTPAAAGTPDMQAVIQLLAANPELLKQALAVAQGAGKA